MGPEFIEGLFFVYGFGPRNFKIPFVYQVSLNAEGQPCNKTTINFPSINTGHKL